MPPREWRLRVEDILEAIERIHAYTTGLDRVDFLGDSKTQDAVIRNLEVIGEAASHVPQEVQTRHPELPWAEMKGLRNRLAHEYFGVGLEIVWETVRSDLTGLIIPLRALLDGPAESTEH